MEGDHSPSGSVLSQDTYLLWGEAPPQQHGWHRTAPRVCRPWRLWHRANLCLAGPRKASWCRRVLLLIVLLLLYSLEESSHHTIMSMVRGRPPEAAFRCNGPANTSGHLPHPHTPPQPIQSKLREDPKVLLFTETQYSRTGQAIIRILVANRIKYKMEVLGKSLPGLTNLSRGKYGVVIFENFERYLQIDPWNRELLDKYLRDYGVGLMGFMPAREETQVGAKLRGFPLYVHSNLALENVSLNSANPVLHLTRAGGTLQEVLPGTDCTVFTPADTTYIPLEWASPTLTHFTEERLIVAILDKGDYDGISRVLFGNNLDFWLHRLLLLDAVSYLSLGRISLSLERYILVDIDDIFVAKKGVRMTTDDVKALLESQWRLQELVPEWRFNLGFNGKYYQNGYPEENAGDRMLLEHMDEFWWFGHMWGHTQPHTLTQDKLEHQMQLNKQFALAHTIPTDSGGGILVQSQLTNKLT